MTRTEQELWDRRYTEGSYTPRADPSPFLERWMDRIPAGNALDLAAGTGRNARLLARWGFGVEAVDISQVAVEQGRDEAEREGLDITWQVADLDDLHFQAASYDLITVVRYRGRNLWPRLRRALAPNGWVLVEHHLQTHLEAGGPSSPEFRLAPGELLSAFSGLRIVHYDESVEDSDHPDFPGERFVTARLVACNGDPGF